VQRDENNPEPYLEWNAETETREENERIYYEWEDTVRTPAKIAFLLTKGFTEEEAKSVPEYPEDTPYFTIEEVQYLV